MPSYSKTIKYLYGLQRFGIKPGLERVKALLSELGDPHLSYPAIHVAGTNGKGSTAAMLEAVLTEAGFRAGLYTSPHLVRFNERIRISGKEISDRDVVRIASILRKASVKIRLRPTFFELTTAMALLYFREKDADIAVIETGMGGRLDATSVVTPLVSVITSIGLDHMEHLGGGIKEIAAEKAGIIKRNGDAVLGEEDPEACRAVAASAKRKRAGLFRLGRDFTVAQKSGGGFDYSGIVRPIKGLSLNLIGAHQHRNAACALAALELIGRKGEAVSTKAIRRGLKKINWPGRMEEVRRAPLVILDGAHNPDGARALKEALLQNFRFRRLTLVVGIMSDKDAAGILGHLKAISSAVVCTAPGTKRAAAPGLLAERLKPYGKPVFVKRSVEGAIRLALAMSGRSDAVCVTGSLFTVGEAKRLFSSAFKR